MSLVHHQDAFNDPQLQIWNNAAFDNGEANESDTIKPSWHPLQPLLVNRSETLNFDSSKENQSSVFYKSPVQKPILVNGSETLNFDPSKENQSSVFYKSPVSAKPSIPNNKPLQPNNTVGNSQGKPLKLLFKQGLLLPLLPTVSKTVNKVTREDEKIDAEIEEIEMEISRLSSKLEALRLEKTNKNLKTIEKPGRIVPAKFMEQKQSHKKNEELSRSKFRKRGLSLGPSEINAGVRFRQMGKPEITPIQSIHNRRVSCFWKISEIDEGKVTKERGGRGVFSLSPKQSKTVPKFQSSKQVLTTVGSKKPVKRDNGVMSCIQPKKLFKEVEKSVSAKKPIKPGRVIASRYNQIPLQSAGNLSQTDHRKRSLPENDKVDSKRCDKKRASSVGKSRGSLPESRVKKQWRIHSETVMGHNGLMGFSPPISLSKMADSIPKIKIVPCITDSSRDSGSAKRVAELIGRKSYFGNVEREVETSVSQALSFEEEKEE